MHNSLHKAQKKSGYTAYVAALVAYLSMITEPSTRSKPCCTART